MMRNKQGVLKDLNTFLFHNLSNLGYCIFQYVTLKFHLKSKKSNIRTDDTP